MDDYQTCDECGDPTPRRKMYRLNKRLLCRDCYETSVARDTREACEQARGLKRGYQEHRR